MVHDVINKGAWDVGLCQLLYCHAGNLYQHFVYARVCCIVLTDQLGILPASADG